jgi:hypothetical protein
MRETDQNTNELSKLPSSIFITSPRNFFEVYFHIINLCNRAMDWFCHKFIFFEYLQMILMSRDY